MKNRLIKITAIIVLAALPILNAGCYPSEAKTQNNSVDLIGNYVNSESSNSEAIVDNASSVNFESENLIARFELPENIPSELPELKITLKKWDKTYMENAFLNGKAVKEKFEYESNVFPGEKYYYYKTEDGFTIHFEAGMFGIDEKNLLSGEFQYGAMYYRAMNELLVSDEELSAFSREDAVSRVNEVLDKLGIKNYGTPKITPIKCGYANNRLSELKKNCEGFGETFDYTPWTAENEMYFLRYPLVYGNIGLSAELTDIPQKEWSVSGSYIDAIVNKDTVIRIRGNEIFSEINESANKVPINCGAVQAFGKLTGHYSNLVLDKPAKYYGCELVYLPSNVTADHMTVSFKPAWQFSGYTPFDIDLDPNKYLPEKQFFYADTGLRYISH